MRPLPRAGGDEARRRVITTSDLSPGPMTYQPQPYTMADIEAERARAGLKCADVAHAVGVSPRLYSEYKRGKVRVALDRANEMLRFIYAEAEKRKAVVECTLAVSGTRLDRFGEKLLE